MTRGKLDLAAIQARVDAASPGPWRHDADANGTEACPALSFKHDTLGIMPVVVGHAFWSHGDFDFIAAARTDVPALVARVVALEAALRDIAEGDRAYADGCPIFGSKHGRCLVCRARAALEGES
jgi:hypothetical protein